MAWLLGGNMKQDIKITYAEDKRKGAVLKVIGVGGAGGNAINRMIEEGLKGVEFVAVNTDIQDLSNVKQPALTLQVGEKLTKGLGAGSDAEIGMQAALESTEQIINILEGSNMVFITAGMGGGTGTGASQVIANHSSSMGILTVAVVTKPFDFEGDIRMNVAANGITNLTESVDAVIVIPNQKLFELEDADIPYKEAYRKVDEILLRAVKGISDIINNAGYQNVDFADVRAAMCEKGLTLMGTGEAKGENRSEEAARRALTSPLLDNVSINGATGLLYNITASSSLTIKEIGVISDIIKSNCSPKAKIKFGIVDDENLKDALRVTVIATGFKQTSKKFTTKFDTKYQPHVNTLFESDYSSNYLSKNKDTAQKSSYSKPKTENQYLFKHKEDSVDLTNIEGDYLNESNLPSMAPNPEDFDDILDVPSFQRPKITEKK
jgi:cell division protein FtsZ